MPRCLGNESAYTCNPPFLGLEMSPFIAIPAIVVVIAPENASSPLITNGVPGAMIGKYLEGGLPPTFVMSNSTSDI